VNCAAEIGRRAAAAGLKLIVDFHYSDFWADPGKQAVPKAWEGMTAEQKADALYDFTCESLRTVMNAGADVAMVQIGNETNQFLCGERSWDAVALLMRSGAQAVRDACPGALVALHFTNPERPGAYADYARQLADRGVDYDVFASSWYPYWHGSLENLSAVLAEVAETWGKSVMVMETSYAYTADDTDFFGNTVGAGAEAGWPFTVEGQADAVRAVINAVAQMKNGIGVVYWEGAWISAGGGSWAENSALWERFGSGWASSFAAEYDPADAGKYYGGCAVDNQALFGPDGTALESLRVFRARP
jgi:arabinogalactan endo-1,4-beta-galactosidase